MATKIAVIGLGYVGLPVAIAFAEKYPGTIGFDINTAKVQDLQKGLDRTGEMSSAEIKSSNVILTSDIEALKECNFYVVAVPTPVNEANIPDLSPIIKASETIGKVLKKGDTVVYESTVYPGVTEEICAPVLAKASGLQAFVDFKLGYSPERINPGDKQRTLSKIIKVVSGCDQKTLDHIAETYGRIIEAGVFKAKSIKVAEAAKVIENTQRDLNIALINELAIIFDKMDIATQDVLEAAGTKWNFLKFKPGLVGGHCIGVDPYYLTYRAEELGLHPQVITAGRRINDSIASFVAQKTVKLMLARGLSPVNSKVGILGLTFKENVSDIRNSKVPSIMSELRDFGVEALVYDPWADKDEVLHEYGFALAEEAQLSNLDALIFAVPHDVLLAESGARITNKLRPEGILIDVKSALNRENLASSILYWSL